MKRGAKPKETLLQLLYVLCTDEHAFVIFEQAAMSSSAPWEKKSDEELYSLVKSALRTGLAN